MARRRTEAMTPVLVLKTDRYVIHHGAVGVIRSLGRLGVPVYAIVEDRFTPAALSRYLAGAFVWETRGLTTERLLEDMAALGERLRRPSVLIPTDDRGAIFVAERAATLRQWFLLPEQAPELPAILANKKDLYFLCKRMGMPCPEAVFPSSIGDVRAFSERASFPVVVKATEAWRIPEGARTTSIAWTRQELLQIYRQTETPQRPNLMFQDYIPRSSAEDWFVHGYRNARTDGLVAFTGRKLRSYPPFAGPTTLAVSVPNDALREQTEAFLRSISYSGIMDIDYRFDRRDGRYKLLDFNPRIGAQFRVFEDDAGVDVVRALYLDLTGSGVGRSQAAVHRTFIVEPFDLFASLSYVRHGQLTMRGWWQSLKGRRELAWFSWDDPLPFVMMCVRLVLRVAGRALRFRRRRRAVRPVPRFARQTLLRASDAARLYAGRKWPCPPGQAGSVRVLRSRLEARRR